MSAGWKALRRWAEAGWEAALGLVYPVNCAGCGGPVEGGRFRYLCPACAAGLHPIEPPACPTCGHPFFGVVETPVCCPHCQELDPVFAAGRSLLLLRGVGRDLVHQFKYQRALYLLDDFEAVAGAACPGLAEFLGGSVLVPVPLHPRKRRERGFNQSERLAGAFARAAGGLAVEDLLRRVVDTPTQTRLNRDERRRNLKNAFATAGGATLNPAITYTVVDDVFTTGSTLNECCRVLRRAGAQNLRVLTLGHG